MATSVGKAEAKALRRSVPRLPALPRPGVRSRLRAVLRATRLDRALANGANPLENAELRLRAEQLVEPEHRLAVARRLEELALGEGLQSPLMRNPARVNRVLMLRLGARLRDPGPHMLPGLAAATLIAHDTDRILSGGCDPAALRDRLGEALATLPP